MLASSGFRDNPRLAHANGEQNLTDAIVDFVRAGVIEFVAFEPDLRPFARWRILADLLCQPLGIIKRRGAADIMFKQVVELSGEGWVLFRCAIFALQIEHERHERFSDIAPAELAEMATIIGLVTERVRREFSCCHNRAPLGRRRQSCPHP